MIVRKRNLCKTPNHFSSPNLFLFSIFMLQTGGKRPKVILEGVSYGKRLIGRKILLSHSENFSTRTGNFSWSRVKKSVNFYGLESDFNVLLDFYWLLVLAEHFKARENCHKRRRGEKFQANHNSKNKNKALFWDRTMTRKKSLWII
jgi:UDP-2,3-diacylglucosamine pyrophosphatase LpxH